MQMMEVRQTDVFADWFAGLRDREARARITVASVASRSAIPATLSRWAAACRRCGSITVLATGCISFGAAATRSSSCSAAVINDTRIATSRGRSNWRRRFREDDLTRKISRWDAADTLE